MELTVAEFIKSNLNAASFMLLYGIIEDNQELQGYIILKENYHEILDNLQYKGYIKIKEDRSFVLRQKALDLKTKEVEASFEEFWYKYHEVTGLKKTDLQATLKYWKKLTSKEKESALKNIENYYDSLPIYSTGKPVKKARTYLGDKNFNDEFVIRGKERSLNKMI